MMTYDEWQASSKRVSDWLRARIPYHHPRMDNSLIDTRLQAEAQKATYALSHGAEVFEINLPFIVADSTGPKHLNCKITQKAFREIVGASFEPKEAQQ